MDAEKTSQTFRDAVQGIIADGMELLPGIEILAAQRLLIPCEMTMVILANASPPPPYPLLSLLSTVSKLFSSIIKNNILNT